MPIHRRDFLKLAGISLVIGAIPLTAAAAAADTLSPMPGQQWLRGFVNVRAFGATGDGKTIDTPAINRAIAAAASSGGGTVVVPAGIYACYSIHLKSNVCLYLDQGAVDPRRLHPARRNHRRGLRRRRAARPLGTVSGLRPQPLAQLVDLGRRSRQRLICGPGLIHGKGLSVGYGKGLSGEVLGLLEKGERYILGAKEPGVGNKAIALKHCHNVLFRDFSILQGGWFGILATGVDNLTIDNLKIDTNRDGMDIDCCRNVRVSNCTVNSPYDDGICPKSSFALGYRSPHREPHHHQLLRHRQL